MVNPFQLTRHSTGVFCTSPGRFWRENRNSPTRWVDMLDGAPLITAPTHVEIAVVGSNPVLAALAARSFARRGRRVALALFDAQDPWAYELLDEPVVGRLLQALVGHDGRSARQTLSRLWKDCAEALRATNSVTIAPGCALGGTIPDFDGSCWFYVDAQRQLDKPGSTQHAMLQELRQSLRGLPALGRVTRLGRRRMVRADEVVLCSYDYALALNCGERDEEGYHLSQLALEPRVQRMGTALRFVEGREQWIRRALADLMTLRDLADRDLDIESTLREAYEHHA